MASRGAEGPLSAVCLQGGGRGGRGTRSVRQEAAAGEEQNCAVDFNESRIGEDGAREDNKKDGIPSQI